MNLAKFIPSFKTLQCYTKIWTICWTIKEATIAQMSVDIIYKILELVSCFFLTIYNRKGSLWFSFFVWDVEESDGFLNNREVAVCTPAGTGVLDPDGVRVLWGKIQIMILNEKVHY